MLKTRDMQPHLFGIDSVLLTNRTVIRRFREGDGAAFFDLLQDNSAVLGDEFAELLEEASDKERAEAYVRRTLSDWLLHKQFIFGIWDNKSAQQIGLMGFLHPDWSVPKAELTCFIHRDYTRKGIMTECLTALLRFGFQQLLLEKIYVQTAMDNYPAQRLVRKCGFRREGDLRFERKKPTGEYVDVMLLALTRQETGY